MYSKLTTIMAVCLVDSGNVCPKQLLQKCQLEFYTTISLKPPSPPLINGAQGLQWAINSMLNSGLTGQNMLCSAYQRLFVCLGADQRSNCLSVPGFIAGQNDFNNASLYTILFGQVASRCESICELAFYKNIPCALNVNMTQAPVISQCYYTFLSMLTNDPVRNCVMLKAYEVCVGKLYMPCSIDTAWCMCDQTRSTRVYCGTQNSSHAYELLPFLNPISTPFVPASTPPVGNVLTLCRLFAQCGRVPNKRLSELNTSGLFSTFMHD